MNLINRFVTEDSGAETVEYALVVGLLAIASIAAITLVGTDVSGAFANIAGKVASAS